MKRLPLLVLVFGSALIMAGGVQAADSDGDGCKTVHATGVGQDLGSGNTTATISHGGFLNGTTVGAFVVTGVSGSIVSIGGTVVLTTKHGGLTATVTGTLNLATGAFTASGPVSVGNGKLAGATGVLTFAGIENLVNGTFTETITGTVCRGDGEDDD